MTRRATTVVCMGPAVNVGSLTEPKTTKSASPPSKLDAERILAGQTALQASLGPRTFPSYSAKRTAREAFPESDIHMPKFRRGFLWSSSPQNNISPAALYTETAPPLPSPPAHLLNDPVVQASLRAMKDHIKVETPFNVERFENLLVDHPNQLFVRSVMTGLREGFWPFHDGEYKVELQVKGENFATDPADLAAIRAYRDKEISASHWSGALPDTELLPGMRKSPMFVVWQKEKPRVITDHKSSGLNDGIPKAEGHVRYDDMHDFGQALHDARVAHPSRKIVSFKSDVQGVSESPGPPALAAASSCRSRHCLAHRASFGIRQPGLSAVLVRGVWASLLDRHSKIRHNQLIRLHG